MPDVRTLTAELEQVNARAQAILTEFKAGMPAEKRTEVLTLTAKAKTLADEIKAERQLDEARKDIADTDSFLNKPQYRVSRAVTPDDEGRKALLAIGWEVKDGIVHAPSKTGPIALYPEDVLFGEVPTGRGSESAAEFYKTTRAAMQPEYRKAFAKFMTLCIKTRSEAIAFATLDGAEQKALSEGTDTAGGFLVPPDVQATILSRTAQTAVVRRLANVQQTTRDVLPFPAVAPHATSGSIYANGFVGGWVGETPAFSDTDPTFQMFPIPVRKLRVATKLSNDFVSDSPANVLAFLGSNGGANMALVEDNGFIAGDGSALQPTGLLNAGAATVDVEGSATNTISNTTSAAGSAPKLITLAYSVPAAYANNASWLMCRSIHGKTHALVDGNGRPMWPEMNNSGLVAGSPPMLLNARVYESDFVPNDGTDANKVYIYGDIGQYIIAQRAQITTVVLRERFADTDQIGIVLFERVGGGLWNTDAIRYGIV